MGYTHYFQQLKDCSPAAWAKLCNALPALALKVSNEAPIAREYDSAGEPPAITEDDILFNGVGNNGHETMHLSRKRTVEDYQRGRPDSEAFHFCKTAEKPYDVIVVALLCLAHTYAPGVWRISSDGNANEWANGLALARRIEPKAKLPISKR